MADRMVVSVVRLHRRARPQAGLVAWRREACHGELRPGEAWQGGSGHGRTRECGASGTLRGSSPRRARPLMRFGAMHRTAWRCSAMHGTARRGLARQGTMGDWQAPRFKPSAPTTPVEVQGAAGCGRVRRGAAWYGGARHGYNRATGSHRGSRPRRPQRSSILELIVRYKAAATALEGGRAR